MAIAMALTALLITLLFRFLIFHSMFQKKIEKASHTILQLQRAQERLNSVLTNQSSETPIFYTTFFPDDTISSSLVISFNAGTDPDPKYSGTLLGRIHVSKEKNLLFTYWQTDKEGYRSEILLQQVNDLQWNFLSQTLEKQANIQTLANNWAWLKDWPKKKVSSPEIIRLVLWCGIERKTQKNPNIQWAFIPTTINPILMVQ